jgi:two-component system CheB/CheR fusion protein
LKVVEEDTNAASRNDAAVPGGKPGDFPIVGVGASAGGLEAFTQMLRALPNDTGMAFVLVQHLSPDRPSMLSDILSRVTSLPVAEVRDQQKVEPDRVYVIPPDRDMVIAKGVLQLIPRETQGQHRPIDHFFHSLAVDQGHRAIGVVLSGTASDGTLGLREIKAAGGITFAQDDTAQQRGMPTSAIAAGCVDLVLAPHAIAEELARVARHPYVVPVLASPPVPVADGAVAAILQVLHRETGVDFLRYKANTLHRRISRRMLLHRIDGLVDYARYLEENPAEAQALYQDILINVTSFFRNPEQFEALESRFLPRLLEGRSPNDPLRAWVVGCSTGEEAYSLAITISETLESAGRDDYFQVFATDLNAAGIEKARAGIYPKSIDRDVSHQRLQRFFAEEDGSYRISKSIRDLCVFARHNVVTDPPFSRVDLVTCRNLLIYLEPDVQQRILPVLHFALNPSGLLLLGSSETAGGYRDLFEVEDAENKIYSKRAGSRAVVFHGTHAVGSPRSGKRAELPTESERGAGPDEEIRRVLLEHFAPAAIVINARMEIVQFRGDTAPYIAPAPGKATLSVLTMARPGFQVPLRASIQRAKQEQVPIRTDRIRVMTDDGPREFSLEVVPIPGAGPLADLYLVVFDSAVRARRTKPGTTGSPSVAGRLRGWARSLLLRDRRRGARGVPEAKQEPAEEQLLRMSQELAASREYLQSIIATQEVANEELQSANEEAQSANEELQSINEELETSKEEIQATSEELTTVNDELQHRTAEISRINDDLVNLINSVRLAIVILGPDMSIRRFTPEAEQMLSLHPADVGRSIHDVKLRIDVLGLEGALAQAIDTGTAQELSVQDPAGKWWSLRIRPYRTVENKVEGAVLMLLDVDALQRSRDYAESIVQAVREPLLVLDGNLTVQRASRAYYEMFQSTPEETEHCSFPDIGNGPWRASGLQSALQLVRSGGQPLDRFEVIGDFPSIGRRVMVLTARRLPYEGDGSLILVAIEDATEQRDAETALITRVADLRAADQSKDEFLAMLAHELRGPLSPIRSAAEILNDPAADDAMVRQARATIERQSQRMARLIDDLLDVARITQRKIDLRREPVDLGSVLERAVELVRDLSGSRGQKILVTAPPVPITLNADPGRLEQVFANLLNNASKFSDRGARVWLTAGLAAATGSSPTMAEVRVRDEGIGIAPELLPRVFDLFLQADRSLERAQGGLGIGLTIVRRLVEMHGGMVEVVSEGLGKGSEFIVRLPAVRQGEGALPRRKPGGGVAAAPRVAPRRVVVADDSVDSADSLGALLSLAGCDVRVVYDGPAALEAFETFRPEVMVLDIGLPGMTGYEVGRRLRAQAGPGEILLIAVTGYGQARDIELSRDAGFDHHLTKPVDIKALRDLLGLSSPPRPQGAQGRG